MKRYLIMGSCMEYMAHLCVDAVSEAQALIEWDRAFPNCSRQNYSPKVHDGTGLDLYRYFSGGYHYTL